jgi:alpha-beta hydrolase superfamily lysophospholipase
MWRRHALAVAVVSVWLGGQALAAGRPVSLTAGDGTPLAGMLYEASLRPAPGVVLVHMLGRSKDEWSETAERLQFAGMTTLAIDLRGHGQSGGYGSELPAMVGDVQAALRWLAGRPGVRPTAMAIAGASLGANLAALAAADDPSVVGVALISPSLDYRGLRLDPPVIKKLAGRPLWLAASTEDPFSLRTIKELAADGVGREQRLSSVREHGTPLLASDQELARALVDWLRARLIF